jgi:uncharacterized membrane protein YfcA
VNWAMVRWLCVGSVPCAFAGVLLTHLIKDESAVQRDIQYALAVALLLAVLGLILKTISSGRRDRAGVVAPAEIRIRRLPTLLLGAAGGLIVGLTSVGSGSLIIVVLLALYPTLRANDLVGTDIVQAIPLVASAALGHVFFGDLRLAIAASVLIGSIPGVLIGARLSSRAPAALVRAGLVVVLSASALKLLNLSNAALAIGTVGMALVMVLLTLGTRGRATAPTTSTTVVVPPNGQVDDPALAGVAEEQG